MAATGTAKRIEQEFNEPMRTLLPRLMKEHKTIQQISFIFKCQQNNVIYWIRKLGGRYDHCTGEWVFPEEDEAAISAA